MINLDLELKTLADFLLLNAGFSIDDSIQSGKLAVALFFSYAQKHNLVKTPTKLGQVYLYEIIHADPRNRANDLPVRATYARGLPGAGVVLEHLVGEGLLQDDMTEVVKIIEMILGGLQANKPTAIDLAEGITGMGLYLFHRLRSASILKNGQADQYKEQLKKLLPWLTLLPHSNRQHEMRIWDGSTGVLLWLRLINDYGLHTSNSQNAEKDITLRLFSQMAKNDFNWHKVEAFFVLSQGSIISRNENLRHKLFGYFRDFVNDAPAHLPEIDHKSSAFIALLLYVTGKKYNYMPACALSESICHQLKTTLSNHTTGTWFGYDLARNTFDMGLYRGICGTALPLLSLQTADYTWLKVLGIDIQL